MQRQQLGFRYHAPADVLAGGDARDVFERGVQVVGGDVQLFRVVRYFLSAVYCWSSSWRNCRTMPVLREALQLCCCWCMERLM